ncbi:hypothetical protein PIB30_028548 [Stylosanthes scabra]|uniref:Uncharacterized protein n=1 Tax=Stylosanthes scabra TaxID=79078 RepID=A0ABU6SB31_9FABA|nr:hypothetical protein [Stylosanthes scabra]
MLRSNPQRLSKGLRKGVEIRGLGQEGVPSMTNPTAAESYSREGVVVEVNSSRSPEMWLWDSRSIRVRYVKRMIRLHLCLWATFMALFFDDLGPWRLHAMATTVKQMGSVVFTFGMVSFILGIFAERKNKRMTCEYPYYDGSVVLGYLSTAFLIASTIAGYLSLFYPYKGKSLPHALFLQQTSFVLFYNIALLTAGLAAAMLLWPTITEQFQLKVSRRVHNNDVNYTCPTAKTGVLGGGALLSLDSSLFWLIALILADNAREDYLAEQEDKDPQIRGEKLNSIRSVKPSDQIGSDLHKSKYGSRISYAATNPTLLPLSLSLTSHTHNLSPPPLLSLSATPLPCLVPLPASSESNLPHPSFTRRPASIFQSSSCPDAVSSVAATPPPPVAASPLSSSSHRLHRVRSPYRVIISVAGSPHGVVASNLCLPLPVAGSRLCSSSLVYLHPSLCLCSAAVTGIVTKTKREKRMMVVVQRRSERGVQLRHQRQDTLKDGTLASSAASKKPNAVHRSRVQNRQSPPSHLPPSVAVHRVFTAFPNPSTPNLTFVTAAPPSPPELRVYRRRPCISLARCVVSPVMEVGPC